MRRTDETTPARTARYLMLIGGMFLSGRIVLAEPPQKETFREEVGTEHPSPPRPPQSGEKRHWSAFRAILAGQQERTRPSDPTVVTAEYLEPLTDELKSPKSVLPVGVQLTAKPAGPIPHLTQSGGDRGDSDAFMDRLSSNGTVTEPVPPRDVISNGLAIQRRHDSENSRQRTVEVSPPPLVSPQVNPQMQAHRLERISELSERGQVRRTGGVALASFDTALPKRLPRTTPSEPKRRSPEEILRQRQLSAEDSWFKRTFIPSRWRKDRPRTPSPSLSSRFGLGRNTRPDQDPRSLKERLPVQSPLTAADIKKPR
jgi:hypothetical protein